MYSGCAFLSKASDHLHSQTYCPSEPGRQICHSPSNGEALEVVRAR